MTNIKTYVNFCGYQIWKSVFNYTSDSDFRYDKEYVQKNLSHLVVDNIKCFRSIYLTYKR